MKKALIILIFLAFARSATASVMFDPDLEWKSIRTPHFWIHYHDGLDDVARRMRDIAERVHARLTRDIGWEPFFRTDVVLVDNMDVSNGFAQPFPHNRIQIYVSRPELDDVLSNFNDWLELVFLHEYVHILNFDTIKGIPALTRYTLGRCCFPNSFLPVWQVEGNAVYHESRDTIYGRNNSTYTDMVMRSEFAAGSFKSISEASHYPRRWPSGSVPYLYGGLFIEYIENRYGRDSFANVMLENADNIIPYLVNNNAWRVYAKDIATLWREWRAALGAKYQKQIDTIKSEALTPCEKITGSGYRTFLPRFHPDGNSVYWVRITNYDGPALIAYSLHSKKERKLCTVHFPGSLSVTSDGGAYLADVEMYRTFSLYSEIFRYDGSYEKLSKRLRALYLDVTKDGKSAVYVKQDGNRYRLMKHDFATRTSASLIDLTDVQIAYPRISPDGNRIIFTMKDRNGHADLVLHDSREKTFSRLTRDSYNDIQPSWHPAGEKILFSSDRTGVYNLYELSLIDKRLVRLTNVLGGAFSPDVSRDGSSIVFSCYDHEGFNIALMPYSAGRLDQPALTVEHIPAGYFTVPAGDLRNAAVPASYSIWNSVLPTVWFPVYFTEEAYENKYDNAIGIMTMGSDTLYRYIYSLTAYALTFQERAAVDAQLMISPFYPDLVLSYFDETLFYGTDQFPWEDVNFSPVKRKLEKKGTAGLAFPFMSFLSQHLLLLAFGYERTITDIHYPGYLPFRQVDTLAYSRAVYSYNSAREYSYSISGEDGRSFYVIYDHYIPEAGSDYLFYKIRGEYAEYLPGPWRNNVFMLRLRGGAAVDAPEHLVPYNLGRFEKGKGESPPDDEDAFGMRGYPSGSVYGERLAVAAVEYRFPVIQVDLGSGTLPFMLRDIWLALFAEYGNVWSGAARTEDFRSSAGAELHMKITLGYYIDLAGYVGYARGFSEPGESQVYFGVNTVYEGALKNRNKWFDFL